MIQQKYTLITGASEGLGKAFALECARRGHNLVLVALPGKELDNLRKLICENYRVKVFIIPQDLSAENSAATIYQQLLDQDIMVDILINNAGIGNTGLFTEEQTIFFEKQIRINVLATTTLTHCLLPMLKQSSQAHI
ncbi:MAG: SDR family NAD(P)-dependent oxidoreductase, partial [Sphingobacteriales bacterium]